MKFPYSSVGNWALQPKALHQLLPYIAASWNSWWPDIRAVVPNLFWLGANFIFWRGTRGYRV